MDPKLAEAYKTNQADETDVEALATAALAEKLAAADEVNVDGMSDDEAEALAAQLLEGSEEQAPAEEPAAEAQPADEGEKTAGAEGEQAEEPKLTPEQEKIAEADYLGRVMAHAYVAERREIEKEAAAKAKTASKLDNLKGAVAMTGAAASKAADKGKAALKSGGGKVMEHLKAKGKTYAGIGAVGGGSAAAGYAAGKSKSKKASAEQPAEETEQKMSALDTLALARAQEILKEHGIDPTAQAEETEKKSSINEEQADLLAQKVEERALALIADAGYELPAQEEAPAEEQK